MMRDIGEVPQAIATKLHALTAPELDEFGDVLFDLKTYTEVAAWLTKH